MLVLDRRTRRLFPFLETIFADGAYGGEKLRKSMAGAAWTIEVVKRSDHAKGFEVLPKRWVFRRELLRLLERRRKLLLGLGVVALLLRLGCCGHVGFPEAALGRGVRWPESQTHNERWLAMRAGTVEKKRGIAEPAARALPTASLEKD